MGSIGVVYDTNVVVSALGFGGVPLEALLVGFDDDKRIIASEETLDELFRVMTYERLPFTEADRAQLSSILRREVELVSPSESITIIGADPSDNAFLEWATAGDGTHVVSGDRHLLDLGAYDAIEIVSPAEFLDRVD